MSSRSFEERNRFRLRDQKHLSVVLVNGEIQLMPYDKQTRLGDILDSALKYCGISDGTLFGLALLIGEFYHFLEPGTRVSRINFKQTRRKSGTSDFSGASGAAVVDSSARVHLRVKFYVKPHTLRERTAKLYYFQQLKVNIVDFGLPCSEEIHFQISSLALQADFGPYQQHNMPRNYFDPAHYFPQWLISRHGEDYLREHMPLLHASHRSMSRAEAVFRYISAASKAGFSMHLCRLTERSADSRKLDRPIWLGISPSGLGLYQARDDHFRVHMSTLAWSQITRINSEKKRFELRVSGGRTLMLYASTTLEAEHLLWLCRAMHVYQRQAQMRAPLSSEDLEEDERRHFREAYIYSDMADLHSEQWKGRAAMHSSLPPNSHVNTVCPQDLRGHVAVDVTGGRPTLLRSAAVEHLAGNRKTHSMGEQDLFRTDILNQSAQPSPPEEVPPVSPPILHPELEELRSRGRDFSGSAPLLSQLAGDEVLVEQLLERGPPAAASTPQKSTDTSGGLRSWRSEATHLNEISPDLKSSSSSSSSSSSGEIEVSGDSTQNSAQLHQRDRNYVNVKNNSGNDTGGASAAAAAAAAASNNAISVA